MIKKLISSKRVLITILISVILLQVAPAFAEMDMSTISEGNVRSVRLEDLVGGGFSDVKSSAWYYADVLKAKSEGLIAGVGDNMYSPQGKITYAQYVTVLVRLIDEDIDESTETGSHWAYKYIKKALELGIVDKNENFQLDEGIPRQDVIKFTCKALGLKPSTTSKIIFKDTKGIDAGYINKAFEEYLTEGVGRDTEGLREFGYGKKSTRAELATMILRVREYKENPTEYKEEKAKEREKADQEWKEQANEYEVWNGYKIPKEFAEHNCVRTYTDIEFEGVVAVNSKYRNKENDFKTMEKVIESKWGNEIAKKIVDYGREKKNIDSKVYQRFSIGDGYTAVVSSGSGDELVSIQIVNW